MQSLLIAAEQKTFNKGKGKELSIVKAEQNELLTQWAEFFVCRLRQTESPGWDGIPPDFYLSFWPEQGPHLLVMIQMAVLEGSFHRDVNTAIIYFL